MAPSFQIFNDTITPHGGSYDNLTPQENNVRNAMYFITLLAPIFGSFIIWLFARKGWSYSNSWSFPRLSILWFLSVSLFGSVVFFQRGSTNRTTFIFAILHTQVEVLINALMLKYTMRKALVLATIWGLLLYVATLALPSMSQVFFVASILGGANDLLIFLLLAYGKQWLYAIGALFHVLSAVIVFADSVIFFNVVLFNILIFLTLWLYLGFISAAILADAQVKTADYIELPPSPRIGQDIDIRNPLADVTVSHWALFIMISIGLIESTSVTVALYIFA